jgi:selenocysteine lyase/cysteine desulfurase
MPFNVKGMSSEDAAVYFDKYAIALRAGLHCAPTAHKTLNTTDIGALRASFSVFNNEDEVKRVINVAKKL